MLVNEVYLMPEAFRFPTPTPVLCSSLGPHKSTLRFLKWLFFFPCYICPLFSELEPAFLTFWTFVFIHKGNFKNCSGLHFWHLAPQIATIRQEQRSEVHLATVSTFHNRIKSRKIGWFSIQAFAQEIKPCMYVFPHTLNFLPVQLKSVCIVFIK